MGGGAYRNAAYFHVVFPQLFHSSCYCEHKQLQHKEIPQCRWSMGQHPTLQRSEESNLAMDLSSDPASCPP
jgi:hypothetical protein